MTRQIDKKIVNFSVVKNDQTVSASSAVPAPQPAPPVTMLPPANLRTEMSEHIDRPDMLVGRTYKIAKSPASEHALYVTINDIILDQGTPHERRRPFEIFINSKNMDQFQWIVAMTRILSAVFRKGGDVAFIVEEMKAVFDPHGGYFRPGGYVPSLIAEIGQIVEKHLTSLGMIDVPGADPAVQAMIAKKREELAVGAPAAPQHDAQANPATPKQAGDESNAAFPPNATLCPKCHNKSSVILDGCATCLNCGYSKCG